MAEVSIQQLMEILTERTKKLILLSQEIIKQKISEVHFSNETAMKLGLKAVNEWTEWDPSQSEDIFEMNKECIDILCDFHHALRIQKYECEKLYCLSGEEKLLPVIKENNEIRDMIDLVIEELGFTN